MTGDYYRQRAPAEFETPWLHLGLNPAQRAGCIFAALILEAVALAVAVQARRKPDAGHFVSFAVPGGLGLVLLAMGWPPDDVGPTAARKEEARRGLLKHARSGGR